MTLSPSRPALYRRQGGESWTTAYVQIWAGIVLTCPLLAPDGRVTGQFCSTAKKARAGGNSQCCLIRYASTKEFPFTLTGFMGVSFVLHIVWEFLEMGGGRKRTHEIRKYIEI